MQLLQKFNIEDKKVLLRLNLNVPIKNGMVKDDFRIRTVMETIEYCRDKAKKTIVIAHLGRPKGKDSSLSLEPVAKYIENLLGSTVIFLYDCIGTEIKHQIDLAPNGSVLLCENLRFHPEELKNDEKFGKELASLAEVYVNDAFGDSAKETASVIWPAKVLPAAAGFRLQEELKNLKKLKDNPEQPFLVIIGGAKIKEKMGVIKSLGKKAEKILIGGGVANTMLKAKGYDIKTSLVQDDEIDLALELLKKFQKKLVLPTDVMVAQKTDDKFSKASVRNVPVGGLAENEAILDIGIQTYAFFQELLSASKTIFWSGPLGYIEWKPSAKSSIQLAQLLAGFANDTYLGGGETASVLKLAKVREEEIDFISTGGGASLKYLSGEGLPGIKVMEM